MQKKIPNETKILIVKDLLDGKLKKSEIALRHGVSNSMISIMSREHTNFDSYKFERDRIIKKGSDYRIRVTTYLKGTVKSKFIKDCLDKNMNESDMSNHIYSVYYFLNDTIKDFDKIAPNKIKTYLIDKIKL